MVVELGRGVVVAGRFGRVVSERGRPVVDRKSRVVVVSDFVESVGSVVSVDSERMRAVADVVIAGS